MSDFLNELNENAISEKEYTLQKKQEEIITKKQAQKAYEQYVESFNSLVDNVLAVFFKRVQEACVSCVRDALYITYMGKRYLVCEIALKTTRGDSNYTELWLQFNCFKLEKKHILESKREYRRYGMSHSLYKSVGEYSIDNILDDPLCKQFTFRDLHQLESYINLESSAIRFLDGYTRIKTLSSPTINLNYHYKPRYPDYSSRTISTHRFLIEF